MNNNFDNFCTDIINNIAIGLDISVDDINYGTSITQSALDDMILMYGTSLPDALTLLANDRRYMLAPEPVFEKPNNKPWYQDRKQHRNKKSRRKL